MPTDTTETVVGVLRWISSYRRVIVHDNSLAIIRSLQRPGGMSTCAACALLDTFWTDGLPSVPGPRNSRAWTPMKFPHISYTNKWHNLHAFHIIVREAWTSLTERVGETNTQGLRLVPLHYGLTSAVFLVNQELGGYYVDLRPSSRCPGTWEQHTGRIGAEEEAETGQ